jgi:LysM repeat protein
VQRVECPLGESYIVQPSDSFASIADAHGISERDLSALNPFVDTAHLAPGQVLLLPAGQPALQAVRIQSPQPPQRPQPQPPQRPQPQPPQRPQPQPPQRPQPQPPQRPQPQPPQRPQPQPPQRPQPQPPQRPQPQPPQRPQPQPPQRPQPQPPQRPQPHCPAGYTAVSARPGDTIASLQIRYNIAYQALISANPTLTGQPQPGQPLCIPPAGARGCKSYGMGPRESLESVATRLRTTPAALLRANPNLAPGDFASGRIICIP